MHVHRASGLASESTAASHREPQRGPHTPALSQPRPICAAPTLTGSLCSSSLSNPLQTLQTDREAFHAVVPLRIRIRAFHANHAEAAADVPPIVEVQPTTGGD
ncbi:hypothetical protein NUW54_g14753 [Trametes sanguinea]|uniref:Uncharacterized protein n=1 Tax=Trametes sanguinea TaxID=158606 RepID=A0ACC1MCB4_9APHY|nr:hypothetical protein NUW54_g14753 [Trametes sanguinea]